MEPSWSNQDLTIEDIRGYFAQLDQPTKPVTTDEVAESLECPPRSARQYLEELAESGEIQTRRMGDSVRAWWTPERLSPDGSQRDGVQFDAFVSAVKDYAIFALEPDGTVASWNKGAKRIKGYSEQEIVGEHFSTFYTDDDIADGVPERNIETAASEGRVEDEGWRVRKDGTHFWANVTITAIRGDSGDLWGFTKVTRDMTDRREYEQQLEAQAERLERQRDDLKMELEDTFERVDDAFYALDQELRFEYVNDSAASYFGKSAGELLGRTPWKALDVAAEDDPVFEQLKTALATQEPTSFERYSDTLEFWAAVRIYPSESGLSVYLRNITDRKRREQALEKSERRYRTLVENFPNGAVVLFDEDLRYLTLGGDVYEGMGDTAESMEGEMMTDRLPEELYEEVEPRYRAVFDEETSEFEVEFNRQIRQFRAFPVYDNDGAVFAGMAMSQDITERREYERELEESNERLEQFAYAVSHDLQEPLRMVSSYLQLIEDQYADLLDEDGEEFIEFAVDGAERMREMIEDLLEYSRVETEGKPFESIELDTVLEDAREDLQVKIEESGAAITSESLPCVEGDAGQLCRVFLNLLSNAIEYSDESPRVHISAERNGGTWAVSVSDEGVGIEPDEQDRIFEIFQRGYRTEESSGTGIGLALCERIVERHGGEIWVESEPGEGATFSFSLPSDSR